jgi:hypothetical protein
MRKFTPPQPDGRELVWVGWVRRRSRRAEWEQLFTTADGLGPAYSKLFRKLENMHPRDVLDFAVVRAGTVPVSPQRQRRAR